MAWCASTEHPDADVVYVRMGNPDDAAWPAPLPRLSDLGLICATARPERQLEGNWP